MGGMVAAIEKGYPQREIAASAYRFQRQLEAGERVMVGVNKYASRGEDANIPLLRVDDDVQQDAGREPRAREGVARRGARAGVPSTRSARPPRSSPGSRRRNLMPPIIEAAKAYCTQQEICDVLREVLGTYTDPAEF